MGNKDLAFNIIRPSTKLIPLHSLIHISGQKLFLPFYHTVSDQQLPHIRHLYRYRNVDEFIADIDYLLKHFTPLSLTEVLAGNIKRPSFFLSFDDGLKEVFNIIYPILKAKGVPAAVFLNSEFIDNKALFYRYKASLLAEKIIEEGITKCPVKNIRNILAEAGVQEKNIINGILKINYRKRHFLDIIATFLEVDFDEFLQQYQPYLSSGEIKIMMENGFSFGGHSLDHPDYRELQQEEQLRQTEMDLKSIAEKFNLSQKIFAFPFTDDGIKSEFFKKLHQSPHAPVATFGGAGLKIDTIPNHFQRIPMEIKPFPAEDLIKCEYFYFLLKSLTKKNFIKR